MGRLTRLALGLAMMIGPALAAYAQSGTTIFAQGKARFSIAGGYGVWNNQDYGIIGLGAGYNLMDGLEAGVDGEAWLGSKPHLYSVSPEVRYTFFQMEAFKPYVGGFYRRTTYDVLKPLDSAGARAGVVSVLSEHTAVSVGLVYENYFRCDTAIYSDCSQTYPEISLSFVY